LIEDSLEGVWVTDENAKTTLVNRSMANLLGYTVEEMMDRRLFRGILPTIYIFFICNKNFKKYIS